MFLLLIAKICIFFSSNSWTTHVPVKIKLRLKFINLNIPNLNEMVSIQIPNNWCIFKGFNHNIPRLTSLEHQLDMMIHAGDSLQFSSSMILRL